MSALPPLVVDPDSEREMLEQLRRKMRAHPDRYSGLADYYKRISQPPREGTLIVYCPIAGMHLKLCPLIL